MSVCVVCQEASNKYKCPKCKAIYCSVKCYKVHKEQDCQRGTPGQSNSSDAPDTNIDTEEKVMVDEDLPKVLSTQQLNKLSSSSYIKSTLKSKRLREHVVAIDSIVNSNERRNELHKMRKNNVQFNEFIVKMLDEIK